MKDILVKELKKNNVFYFNHTEYIVKTKYRSDDKPLVTVCGQYFHYEGLTVQLISKK